MKEKYQNILNNFSNCKDFHAEWDDELDDIVYYYQDVYLDQITDDIPILPRQLGYPILVSDLKNLGIEISSAEVKNGKERDPEEIYHLHYYSILKPISDSKVRVRVKYFDVPNDSCEDDLEKHLYKIKGKVRKSSTLKLLYAPYGFEVNDVQIIAGGNFRIRPNTYGSFYFEIELDGRTYGDILLQVDQIIHDLEK